jgi:hypothetical protein
LYIIQLIPPISTVLRPYRLVDEIHANLSSRQTFFSICTAVPRPRSQNVQ